METVYKDIVGKVITLTLEEGGSPISLTSATVLLNFYSFGTNTLKQSRTCTVTDATNGIATYTTVAADFDTAGLYYTLVGITYTPAAAIKTIVDKSYEVIENQENVVTVSEFLEYIQVPSENAPSDNLINTYLEQAESLLNLEIPRLENTTDAAYIRLKQNLIKIRAAILYFMNLGENNVNPDIRIQKIEMWTKIYNNAANQFYDAVSSTDTTAGSGVMRRVKSSEYEDSSSYLYDG